MTENFDRNPTAASPIRPPRAPANTATHATRHDPDYYRGRSPIWGRIRLGAVIALALAAAFATWFVLHDRVFSSKSKQPAPPSAVSVQQLESLATSLGHPVFWLGPKAGYTYELTQTQSGKIYVRYLPPGVAVGANTPYLTVATYPFAGAFAAMQKQAKVNGAASVALAQGGLAVLDRSYPKSVHLAYPGVDYQVEVFDPTPEAAMRTVAVGNLAVLGPFQPASPTPTTPAAQPTAASAADLKSLARTLGHPIYWVGPAAGQTYELTNTSSGRVFVRYLPAGVAVGVKEPHLTVGTYPVKNAFAVIRTQSKKPGTVRIPIKGGAVAFYNKSHPTSVYVAYPGVEAQVEVYDPSPARARSLVASQNVTPVG